MKVAVIGCTHAGTFAAQETLTNHPDWDVTVYESHDNLSFLSCGIALWVGGHVAHPEKMFYATPDTLAQLGAHMKMQHTVLETNLADKTLKVKNLVTGDESVEQFDKIIVTTGSSPVIPPIEGIDNPRVKLCKNWNHANELKKSAADVKSVVVIGSGYIGAELAEAYATIGKEVTLVDALPHALGKNFDTNISEIVEQDYRDHGVTLALNEKVVSFNGTDQVTVKTDKGAYTADIAVLCVGFKPNTGLFKGQVEMLGNGAIITDEYMQTSVKDVYAAGDSSTVFYNPTQKPDYIPLATNAVRQGLLIGRNIETPTEKYMGTQATSAVELFGRTYSGTGLTVEGAKVRGIEVATTTLEQDYRPDFMPSTTSVLMNLMWSPETRQVLGASFTSQYDIAQAANVVSMAIQTKMTIDQLAMVDMFFQPNYDQPVNYVNAIAMQAVAESK
ncbi:FAD-dependent oxidoreductase [Latilactobacillus fuchuensis]|uniref:NADH oxidase n=1 Tax=Latilactobacillus fuchuensis TaxID=164393 RepID=A0A2N9DVU4_9LACO|nr:FAD-dependent oxidoreductase [Latilactobacillus fuchuensis]SPC38629.1 NADH oxidase [Latilactobacillus fuchuensis]